LDIENYELNIRKLIEGGLDEHVRIKSTLGLMIKYLTDTNNVEDKNFDRYNYINKIIKYVIKSGVNTSGKNIYTDVIWKIIII